MKALPYAEKQYQNIKRLGPSPRQTVLSVYSEVITACFDEDSLRAIKAMATLQLSINPNDTSELSIQLSKIYEHCLQLIQEQDFSGTANILIELRSALTS